MLNLCTFGDYMAQTFFKEMLKREKEKAFIYQDAIDALVSGRVSEYTLDTGQDRQTVKRNNIKELEDNLELILNRVSVLEARCGNSRTVIIQPC